MGAETFATRFGCSSISDLKQAERKQQPMAGRTTAPERDTTTRRSRRRSKAPRVVESPVPTPVVAPTRTRRLPAVAALSVALLALTTLMGWAAYRSVSATVPVVGVQKTIVRGTLIQRGDLTTVQIGKSSTQHTIPFSEVSQVVGRRAATDLPAGGIVPADALTDAPTPGKDRNVVGIFARDGSAPLIGIEPGTRVRLVPLPATQEQPNPPKGQPQPTYQLVPGVVVASTPTDDGTGVRIDVDIAAPVAPGVQMLAAQNRIAVVIDTQVR